MLSGPEKCMTSTSMESTLIIILEWFTIYQCRPEISSCL